MNVIIAEVDESHSALAIVDHGTNLIDSHRSWMRFDAKSKEGLIDEDPNFVESNNVGRSLNTLYGIGAPQNAGELNRAVEVLTLLRLSKDQATHLRDAGMSLYEALPTIPSHGDPLVITLLLGGRLQPRLFVDEGSPVNILFKYAIEDLKVEDRFVPPAFLVVGFSNNRIMPLRVIELHVSFIDGDKIVNIVPTF